MSKLKEIKEKLNLKVALAGGAIIVSSSLGTCHFLGEEQEVAPEVEEAAPVSEPVEEPAPEEEAAE